MTTQRRGRRAGRLTSAPGQTRPAEGSTPRYSGALGITIHDHLVIGRKGHASFRSLGLI
jgi:hypothetical protein